MTIHYMRVAAINKFVQALEPVVFAELTGDNPTHDQPDYDYSQHFLCAADADDPDFIPDLDLDAHFSSEGPCDSPDDDSYCSYDPDRRDRLPTGSVEIMTAQRVIEAYLRQGGKSYATSDEAIESEI